MIHSKTLFYILLVLIEPGVLSSENNAPVVETPLGKVRGFTMTSRSGRTFFAFRSIPYAKPPVKELRFQPPQPVDPWNGVKDSTDFAPYCLHINIFDPQHNIVGQEDCLYLSVFTPDFSGKKPVLVHFHLGAYTFGNNRMYEPHYLMDEDIVIVHVNYRLGILGFLSFETPDMPGNQAMKDQVMALRWVQQNIASFGGNSSLVTIIGESAGGGSVYNHVLSPLSKGLFHRAFAQSGTTYSPWGVAPPGFGRSTAEKLMKLLDCPRNSQEALPCLLKKDAKLIVSKFTDFIEWQMDPILNFGPVLEQPGPDAFLVGPVSKWEHEPVPLVLGLNSAEGLLRTSVMLMYKTDFHWLSDNFDRLAPMSLAYLASASNPNEITKSLRQYYLPEKEITMNHLFNLTMLYSDAWFVIGGIDAANYHTGSVYFYHFDYPMSGKGAFPVPKELLFGSFHCADMALLWNLTYPIVSNVETEEEITLSKKFIKHVINFMKYGDPTPEGNDLVWKKWTPEEKHYLNIDKGGFHMKQGFAEDRYKFWKSLKYRDNFV